MKKLFIYYYYYLILFFITVGVWTNSRAPRLIPQCLEINDGINPLMTIRGLELMYIMHFLLLII